MLNRWLERTSLLACLVGFTSMVACKGGDEKKPAAGTNGEDKPAANQPGDKDKAAADTPVDLDKPETETPPASTAKPGTVRVVIDYDVELLKSEARAFDTVESKLAKEKDWTFNMSDAAADEKSASDTYVGGAEPKELPAGWTDNETIIIFVVAKPLGKKPKRTSRGLSAVFVVRPPSVEAVYTERFEGDEGNALYPEKLAEWILSFAASTLDSTTPSARE